MRVAAVTGCALTLLLLGGCDGGDQFAGEAKTLAGSRSSVDIQTALEQMMGSNREDAESIVTDAFCSATAQTVNDNRPPDANDLTSIAMAIVEQRAVGISANEISDKVDQLQAAGVLAQESNAGVAYRYVQTCHTLGIP